jgi:hypothetical protein
MSRPYLLLLLGLAPGAFACDPPLEGENVVRLESQRYVLAYRTRPGAVRVGEHFTLEAAACAKGGAPAPESLGIDAHMPAHRHGMNYAPAVREAGAGRWRAQGLMFHMPGEWELRFDLRAGGATERLTHRTLLD